MSVATPYGTFNGDDRRTPGSSSIGIAENSEVESGSTTELITLKREIGIFGGISMTVSTIVGKLT